MSYDLAVATTTCFDVYGYVKSGDYRRGLWKLFMESLVESDFDEKKIILLVSDDASPEPPQKQFTPFDCLFLYHRDRLSFGPNALAGMNIAVKLAPVILSVDSDAYFHPDWVKWLFMAMKKYPNHGGYSLFNSPRHGTMHCELEPGIYERTSSQEHGLAIRSELFVPDRMINVQKSNFVVPKVSMIQHTGSYGVNNCPKESQDYDPNFPYNTICGIDLTDHAGF